MIEREFERQEIGPEDYGDLKDVLGESDSLFRDDLIGNGSENDNGR